MHGQVTGCHAFFREELLCLGIGKRLADDLFCFSQADHFHQFCISRTLWRRFQDSLIRRFDSAILWVDRCFQFPVVPGIEENMQVRGQIILILFQHGKKFLITSDAMISRKSFQKIHRCVATHKIFF